MRGLSLFSGIGGLDLAFEWAGGEVAGMCEIEPYCRKILQKHWPDVPLYGDVKELRGEDIGAVDIIYGGFPCQPFSVAGKQKGRDDCRYLWPEFSRLVGEIRPRWVVGENVPGILHIAADDVCADLEHKGYSVGIFDFEAAAVGASHRRERFFFVAHANSGRLQKREEPGILRTPAVGWITTQVERPGGASLPNSDNIRRNDRGVEKHSIHGEKSTLDDAKTSSQASADSDSTGREEQEHPVSAPPEHTAPDNLREWGTEPGVGRVAHGIPHRVDRLRALGNAVVPQQAYPIFRAIMEQEDQR